MSNSVDNRVVSMEFDNAKFERNVETSLNTLKHLDKSLDDLRSSSGKFDGVSFENLANSIDAIANKFTFMGRITLKVFDEIADGIVNLGKKMLSFNTDQISSGWQKYADKTESVQTIMSATGREIEYVEEQLDRLNRFSDETSYSFVDMTSNIAKFTSQGIDLESAVTSMQGIATWAASAGQNAQAASRAMYNISQAMGVGAMHLIDWKSIQNANMATKEFKEQAIAAGLALGTLEQKNGKIFAKASANSKEMEVTIQNFSETLKNDWLSSDVMTKVFTEYGKFADLVDATYEKFDENILVSELMELAAAQKEASSSFEDDLAAAARKAGVDVEELRKAITALNAEEYEFSMKTYKAAQEAKTFKDAVDAAADAISTSWMKVFQTIFGNYEQAKEIWTSLANWFYDLFAEPINSLNDILGHVFDDFKELDLGEFDDRIEKTALDLLDMGDAAEKAFKDLGLLSDADIKKYGSAREAIKNLKLTADDVGNVIDKLLGEDGGAGPVKKGIDALEEYKQVVQDIWHGKYGSGQERKDALTEAGYDADAAQNLLNKWHYGIQVTQEDLDRLTINGTKLTEEEIAHLKELNEQLSNGTAELDKYIEKNKGMTGRQMLFDKERGALYNMMNAIDALRGIIGEAWKEVFGGSDDRIARIKSFLATLQASTEKLKLLLTENTQVIDTVKNAFKAIFTVVSIGVRAVKAFVSAVKQIIDVFKPSGEETANFVNKISELIFKFDEWLKEHDVFKKATDAIVNVFKGLKSILTPIIGEFKNFINTLKGSAEIKQAFETIQTAIQNFSDKIKALNGDNKIFTTILNTLFTIFSIGLKVLAGVIIAIAKIINLFKPGEIEVSGFVETFSNLIKKFDEWLEKNKIIEKAVDIVVKVFKTLKDTIGDLIRLFSDLIKTGDLKAFFSGLGEKFKGLFAWTTKVKDAFQAWFSKLGESNPVVSKVTEGFSKLLDTIKGFYSEKIVPIFTNIKNALSKLTLGNIVNAFSNLKNSIVDFFKILWDFIKTGNWQKFVQDIGERFASLVQWIEKVRDTFVGWFEGFDKNTLKALMSLIGGLLGLIGVFKLLKSFGSIKYGVLEFLDVLSDTVRSFKRSRAIADMSTIAIAIGVLVSSLYALTKIPANDLSRCIKVLGQLLIAIGIAMVVIGIIANTPGAANASGMALAISSMIFSVSILIGALWLLTKMDFTNIDTALTVLISIMALLALLALGMSRANVKMAGNALGIISYALGILLLVKALKAIQENTRVIGVDAFRKLFTIILVLIGMGMAMRNVRFGSALGLVTLAASLVFIQKKLREAMVNAISIEEFKTYSYELATMFGLLIGLGLVLRISGKGNLGSVLSILALIGLLFVVSKAIMNLGSIPEEQLTAGTKTVSIIGAVFAALIFAIGNAAKIEKSGLKAIKSVMLTLIGVLIALVVLSAVPWDSLKHGLLATVSVIGALALVIFAAGTLMKGTSGHKFWDFATVALIVGSIFGLMVGLGMLSTLVENPDTLVKTAASMAIVMLALAGTMAILSKASFVGFDSTQAIQMIVKMIAALIPAIAALWALQYFNIEASIPTVIALGILLVALAGAVRILNDSRGDHKKALANGVALALAAGALIGIAFGMQMLNDVSTEGLIPKVYALIALLGAVTAAVFALSYAKRIKINQVGSIAVMMGSAIAAMALLALMMKHLLPGISTEDLIPKVIALSALFAVVAAAVFALSYSHSKTNEQAKSVAIMLGAAVIAMAGVAASMLILNYVNPEGLIPKVEALALLFAALVAAVVVLGYAKNIRASQLGTVAASMGIMVLVFAAIAALMPLLDNIQNVDGLITKSTAISELIIALSAAVLILSHMKAAAFLDALAGVGILSVLIVALVAVVTLIGAALTGIEGAADAFMSGAQLLGDAIGTFVGAIIGGIAAGAVEAATDLDSFVQSLTPVMDQLSRFDNTSIAGIQALGSFLTAVATANLADSVGSFIDFGLSLLGFKKESSMDKIKDFAESITDYVDAFKELDSGDIHKAARISEAVAVLINAMPKEGGFSGLFKGTTSEGMTNMGEGMKAFGTALKEFVTSVADIPADAVTKTEVAVQVAAKINEFAETLQKTGGLVQEITGISDIGNFGTQLGKFVIGLFGGSMGDAHFDGFFTALEQANLDGSQLAEVEKLKELTTPLVEIAEMIPTMGGFIGLMVGDSDPTTFAEAMVDFVQGLKKIIDETAGITDEQIAQIRKAKEAALAAKELAAASEGQNIDLSAPTIVGGNETSSEASIVEKAVGGLQSKLSAFDIGSFSETMQRVKDSLNFKDVDTSNVEQSVTTLQTATETIGSSGEVINSVAESCGQYFATLSESTAGISETVAAPLIELQNSTSGFSSSFDTQLNAMIESTTSKSSDMQSGATTFFHAFPSAMESETAVVTENASTMVTGASAVLTTGADQASTAGYYFTAGFAQGILSGSFLAEQAARSVVQKASNAMESAAQEKSPSKLTQKFGSYFSQGFAIGILDESGTIRNASIKATKVAIDTVRDTMEAINNIIEEESSPVIRPVLDLTNLKEGAGYISSMTSGNIAAMASIQTADYRNTASFLAGQDHSRANSPIYNLVIDGIKYNTDDYVDNSIQNFVETMVRKNKMYSGR